jgi:uncharacterized protein (DUF1697 family)
MKATKRTEVTACVAFLRGINVGGNKPIKMEDLKKTFESLRFSKVQTVLASGNVVFETTEGGTEALAAKIEAKLKTTFGHQIGVIVRTIRDLARLEQSDPFKGIKVTPETRLYVTFLPGKAATRLQTPYRAPGKTFKIVRLTDTEVCSALTLTPGSQTTQLMASLEKEFGRQVTTRNWNTIARILKSIDGKA